MLVSYWVHLSNLFFSLYNHIYFWPSKPFLTCNHIRVMIEVLFMLIVFLIQMFMLLLFWCIFSFNIFFLARCINSPAPIQLILGVYITHSIFGSCECTIYIYIGVYVIWSYIIFSLLFLYNKYTNLLLMIIVPFFFGSNDNSTLEHCVSLGQGVLF